MTLLVRRIAAFALLGWCAVAGVAHADAAGPTNYRSEIVSVMPASDLFDVTIEGGDAFVALDVEPGTEVIVLGYGGEPYLLIDADGTVSENALSPATYANQDRFGTTEIPDSTDETAEPEWRQIGSGGTWAWHDHRAHWMSEEPLIGLEAGDSLPPEQIDLLVDGAPVAVTVTTTLVAPPSAMAPVFGAIIGVLIPLLGALLGPATMTLFLVLVSTGALVVGANQYLALPASTGPLLTWWLLPALALTGAIIAIVTYGRSRWLHLGLNALAALQLAVWGWQRRQGMSRPVLPTTLPAGFDRFVTAAAIASGVLAVVFTVRTMFETTADSPIDQLETGDLEPG